MTFGYYLFTLALFKFFYAFLITAYQAWLPEIANPEERPNVAAIQNIEDQLEAFRKLIP